MNDNAPQPTPDLALPPDAPSSGAPASPAPRRVVCRVQAGSVTLEPTPVPGTTVTLALVLDGLELGETSCPIPAGDFATRKGFRDFLLDRFSFHVVRRFLMSNPRLAFEGRGERVAPPFGSEPMQPYVCGGEGGPYHFLEAPPRSAAQPSPAPPDSGGGNDDARRRLDATTHRALARLALAAEHPWAGPAERATRPPLRVVFGFGRDTFPGEFVAEETADRLFFSFQCARRYPVRPVVHRVGNRVTVAARRLSLLTVARTLFDLGGGGEIHVWTGAPAAAVWPSPPGSPAGAGPRPHFRVFDAPGVPRGETAARFPWDVVGDLGLVAGVGISRGFPFHVALEDLFRLMPARPRYFASRAGLHAALADLFLGAAQEGAFLACEGGPSEKVRPPAGHGFCPNRWFRLAVVGMAAVRRGKRERNFQALWGRKLARRFAGAFLRSLCSRPLSRGLARAAVLTGCLAGLFRRPSGLVNYPPVDFPEGPVRRIELDLVSAAAREVGDPAAPTAFALIHIGDAPFQVLGTPVGPGVPTERLARRLRLETLLWKTDFVLRWLSWKWWDRLLAPPAATVSQPGSPADGGRPELILATRDRPRDLERLVASMRRSSIPVDLRIIDSAPTNSDTRDFCAREGIVYHLCPHPGKSRALNLGIQASRAEILLFTDDDAVVDERWAETLRDGFYRPEIQAVMGLVLPLRVATRAQYLFEHHVEIYDMGGLRRGFWEKEYGDFTHLFSAARVGTGVNMAIRRQAFSRLGPLDTALSPGTPTGAGEEIDFYFRLLQSGGSIYYQPRARVWHDHRDSMDRLRRQLYNYGLSSGAYSIRWALYEKAPAAIYYLWKWYLLGPLHRSLQRRPNYPRGLVLLEAWGSLLGPVRYFTSRRLQRRFDREERSAELSG